MAELVLWHDELDERRLPPVCMRCGAPSQTVVWHTFRVAPESSGLRGGLLALALHRRLTVPVPLCGRHRGMWRRRNLFVAAAALLPFFCMAGVFLVALASGWQPGQKINAGPVGQAALGVLGLGFALSLIFAVVAVFTWRSLAIRAVEIDEDRVVLTGVAEPFLEALERGAAPALPATGAGPAVPRTHRPPPGPTVRDKMRRWGFVLLVLGGGTLLLPHVGLQLKPMIRLGSAAPMLGVILAVVGALLVALSLRPGGPSEGGDES